MLFCDTEGLRQFSRPVAEVFNFLNFAPSLHFLYSLYRFKGADKHGFALAFLAAYDVKAMVHSVDQVNIDAPGRPEHRRVTRGDSSACVTAGVVAAKVRFRLDNYALQISQTQVFTQQGFRKIGGRPVEEFFSERHWDHYILIREEFNHGGHRVSRRRVSIFLSLKLSHLEG